MNFKTTIVLLILVLAGGGLWFVAGTENAEEPGPPAAPAASKQGYLLDPQPAADEIVRVRVARPGEAEIVFERDLAGKEGDKPGDWRMVEPVATKIQTYIVDSIVRAFAEQRSQRSFFPGEAGAVSLEDAGLVSPRATFTLVTKDDKSYTFKVGGKPALSNDTYVSVSSADQVERVHVVRRDYGTEIKRDANAYRTKTPFRITQEDVVAVSAAFEGRTYRLTRGDDGEWVIDEPVKAYAAKAKVAGLISAVSGLSLDDFIDDAPAALDKYGLDQPYLSISIRTERTEEVEKPAEEAEPPASQPSEPVLKTVVDEYALVVGAFADLDESKRYVKLADQPWVASVGNTKLEKMTPKLSELRDNRVARLKANDATELALTVGTETVTLTRTGGEWAGEGDLAAVEGEAVRNLLQSLEDLRAIDFVDDPGEPSEYGLDAPRAVIGVTASGAVEPVVLQIGNNTPSGRNTYVRVAGRDNLMVIAASKAKALLIDPITLRSRVIFDITPESIRTIELTHNGMIRKLETSANQAAMVEPKGARVDPERHKELIENLARLRAKKVVAKDDFDRYGLGAPQTTLRFTVEEVLAPAPPEGDPEAVLPPETRTVEHLVRIARIAALPHCRVDDLPYVFELDATVYPVLTGELIRRALFDFEPDAVTKIAVESRAASLAFERTEEGWKYAPDPYVQLSQQRVEDFLKRIVGLKAVWFEAYEGGDVSAVGGQAGAATVSIETSAGESIVLRIALSPSADGKRRAGLEALGRVFSLRNGDVKRLNAPLDTYLEGAEEEAADPNQS